MARAKREKVMLALPADERRIAGLGSTFGVQPKLRGVRGRREDWTLYSSYNKEFVFLDHIKRALGGYPNLPYDGEIYRHGWKQQQINSAAKPTVNYNSASEELEYHIYDVQLYDLPWEEREERLSQIEFKPPLVKVETKMITTGEWKGYLNSCLDRGFEGMMFRGLSALYIDGKTVKNQLLKFKPSEVDTYWITAVLEAISLEGVPKAMVGAFMVRDKDGTEFKVSAGKLSHPERIRLWGKREQLPGLPIVVAYEPEWSERGVPTCAVTVEVIENG